MSNLQLTERGTDDYSYINGDILENVIENDLKDMDKLYDEKSNQTCINFIELQKKFSSRIENNINIFVYRLTDFLATCRKELTELFSYRVNDIINKIEIKFRDLNNNNYRKIYLSIVRLIDQLNIDINVVQKLIKNIKFDPKDLYEKASSDPDFWYGEKWCNGCDNLYQDCQQFGGKCKIIKDEDDYKLCSKCGYWYDDYEEHIYGICQAELEENYDPREDVDSEFYDRIHCKMIILAREYEEETSEDEDEYCSSELYRLIKEHLIELEKNCGIIKIEHINNIVCKMNNYISKIKSPKSKEGLYKHLREYVYEYQNDTMNIQDFKVHIMKMISTIDKCIN